MKSIFIRNLFKLSSFLVVISLSFFTALAQMTEKPEPNLARQYQKLASSGKPVYISADLAFEQVSLFFSDTLEQIEKDQLSKNLENGLSGALDQTTAALKVAKDGTTREVLSADYAYLLTALRLLLPENSEKLKAENIRAAEVLISPDLRNIADELKLVLAAKELNKSPLLGYTEDYSQYAPRGRYTKSEEQTRYFRAVVWLGRMGFYLEPNAGSGINEKSADNLTARGAALIKIIGAANGLTDYDRTMTALVGASDDLTIGESILMVEKATDKKITELSFQEIIAAAPKIRTLFKSEARKPKILSTIALEGATNPVAIRLIGQRFTPDSYVFQNLTFSKVQDFTGKETEPLTLSVTADGRKVRGVPRVFDVLDALGMPDAATEIEKSGDQLYKNYEAQRALLRREMPLLLKENNFTTLYLSAIQEIKAENESGAIDFNRRRLNTAIGAYTLLRHNLAAYAKQSYSNTGRGLQITTDKRKTTPLTFVENLPKVFRALQNAVEKIAALPETKSVAARAGRLTAALRFLADNAGEKPLAASKAAVLWQKMDDWAISEQPTAVIADVQTDLNSGQVLQIGVGFPQILTVGKAEATVFSNYEFRQPLNERLTDEQWQKLLKQPNNALYRQFELTLKTAN